MQLNNSFVNSNRPSIRTEKPTAPLGGLLDSGVIVEYEREERIFSQGDPADTVMWICEGRVRPVQGFRERARCDHRHARRGRVPR